MMCLATRRLPSTKTLYTMMVYRVFVGHHVGHKQLEPLTEWATLILCVCLLIGGEDIHCSRLCYTNPQNSRLESILNVDFSNKYSKMLTIQPPAESTQKIVLMATQTLFAHWLQIKNAPLELWGWFSVFIVFFAALHPVCLGCDWTETMIRSATFFCLFSKTWPLTVCTQCTFNPDESLLIWMVKEVLSSQKDLKTITKEFSYHIA